MKFFIAALIGSITLISYGQESKITSFTIDAATWEALSMPLVTVEKESKYSKYILQEVNIHEDLRAQAFKKSYSMYIEKPKFKDVTSKYKISNTKQKTSGFTITGSGYNANNKINSGDVKNNAYKDASSGLYRGYYFFPAGRSPY
ncbi:hypothetical protein [Aquimarina sediminis]|uniref:hypothetical protein n=1 Tax=Aquimarina sediminis TaxID=2070536 RepID=UPI000CA06E47|nr:hypothetical protein [Aquimarina sediminis]